MAKKKRGTGKPDPKKDRSAHAAKRGVKQMALADISKQRPSEEQLEKYPDLIIDESDRGSAIMASALVDNALEMAIICRLTDHGDKVRKSWFEGDNAPFGTFSAKIQLGMALGIYGPVMHKQLSGVKNIRNQFAHCSLPLDFNNPAIAKAVEGLSKTPLPKSDAPHKVRFGATCLLLARLLAEDGFKHGGKEMEISYP